MRHVGIVLLPPLLLTAACSSSAKRDDAESASGPNEELVEGGQDGGSEPNAPVVQSPGGGGQDADSFLAQEAARLTLEEQKTDFLVEQHIVNAQAAMAAARLSDARDELDAALSRDPDNLEANEMRAEVGALLGEGAGEVEVMTDSLVDLTNVRRQQLEHEVRQGLNQGRRLRERGNYDGAIAELSIALDHLRWNEYSSGLDTLRDTVAGELEATRRERTEAEARNRAETEERAWAELRAREEAARQRDQARLDSLISEAIAQFDSGDYDDAMETAEEALRNDPRNEQAVQIRDAAFRAGRHQVQADYIENRRERFRQWTESMEELQVPYNDIITLPDREFWADITERRAQRPGIDLSRTIDPEEDALRNQLTSTRIQGLVIEADSDDSEDLNLVIGAVRNMTNLPLVVHPMAQEAVLDEGAVFDLRLNNPISVENVLDLIAEQAGPEVVWTIRHNAILVTTLENAGGEKIIYNHDINDLIFGLTDFLGPRIDQIRLLDEIEDDDGGGPFGAIGERNIPIEPDDLATLVQENVHPESWDEDGVFIQAEEGFLLIVHRPEVQAAVRQFLEDLRRFGSSLVTIESKFMTVEENWLQEIGVDFRGLDNPGVPFTDLDDITNGLEDQASGGLDNSGSGDLNVAGAPSAGFFYDDGEDGSFGAHTEAAPNGPLGQALSNIGGMVFQYTLLEDAQVSAILTAVEKSSEIEIVNDQVLSVHNTQKAHVAVINQRAYIQDFDVEVAQFEAVADPQINVLTEGVVLDVRPTIHHDRRYLTLEVQPTVAEVVALTDFSTTLGGQTSAVQFQLPELQVQSVFTTAVVPDGGSILLGGLSRMRNIERRSEVPWLANIPLVGFFFKEEGYNDEKSSLMIMLRARITDVKEELAQY